METCRASAGVRSEAPSAVGGAPCVGCPSAAADEAQITRCHLGVIGDLFARVDTDGSKAIDAEELLKIKCSPEPRTHNAAHIPSPDARRTAHTTCGRVTRCTVPQLRQSGFYVYELRRAHVPAKTLEQAGCSAAELREGGFTAEELMLEAVVAVMQREVRLA